MACGWDVSYAGCPGDQEFIDSVDPDTRALAEEMSTDLLNQWTGGLYGVCEAVIRPCRETGDPHAAEREFLEGVSGRVSAPWSPVLIDGEWFNVGCGSCTQRCGCLDGTRALVLPWPVDSVTSVMIGPELVPGDAYRVDARRILVRTDGGTWPTSQDMLAEPGDPDTFVITFMKGLPVPAGGRVAAGVLAMELMKAMCDDGSCQLPQRVQSVTRQGVTVAMMDNFEDLGDGRTGIWVVDSWVASVTQPRKASRVYSVDIPFSGKAWTNATH